MRFQPEFLEEIISRLPVSVVVGRKVKLKRAGREWNGLSPFTAEKTPSFYANDQKMRWFDFSAGKNGNIFDFVMETEGLSFPEAVEKLAQEAGVALPAVSREDIIRETRRTSAIEAMELASAFFEAQLRGREGSVARSYLMTRGLSDSAIDTFRIGYAPKGRFTLRDYLAGKGVTPEAMIEGGLLIHGDDIAVPYDRFRDRVMFPICDRSGRVIAFGGRALEKDQPAKYLNSPETPLFHKGAVLYNHHRARLPAHDKGRVIAVEGYVDVIAMTTAGFPETVAACGTALTPDQCGLLWRMAEEPILCFDGDSAGRKAAFRAIDTALPLIGPGRSLRFALLPDGQDPDDLVRSGGAGAVTAAIEQARPLVELLWARERDAQPLDTPERRVGLEARLREACRAIPDPSLRRHYEEALAARAAEIFGRARRGPWQASSRAGSKTRFGGRFSEKKETEGPSLVPTVSEGLARTSLWTGAAGVSPRDALILVILLNHPTLIAGHAEDISALAFGTPDLLALRNGLLAIGNLPAPVHADVEAMIARLGLGQFQARLVKMALASRLWSIDGDASPLDASVPLGQALALHRRASALNNDLRVVEADFAVEPSEKNYQRLRDIRTQLSALEGTEAAIDQFGAASGRQIKPL